MTCGLRFLFCWQVVDVVVLCWQVIVFFPCLNHKGSLQWFVSGGFSVSPGLSAAGEKGVLRSPAYSPAWQRSAWHILVRSPRSLNLCEVSCWMLFVVTCPLVPHRLDPSSLAYVRFPGSQFPCDGQLCLHFLVRCLAVPRPERTFLVLLGSAEDAEQ